MADTSENKNLPADSKLSRRSEKDPYIKPHLQEYGSLAKLTQGAPPGAAEGAGMTPCL